jgi:hypothetical protein
MQSAKTFARRWPKGFMHDREYPVLPRAPRARPPRDLERGWTLRVARENLPLHCSLLAVRAVGEQPAAVAEHWQCLARDAEDIVCLLASMRTEARLIIDGTVCPRLWPRRRRDWRPFAGCGGYLHNRTWSAALATPQPLWCQVASVRASDHRHYGAAAWRILIAAYLVVASRQLRPGKQSSLTRAATGTDSSRGGDAFTPNFLDPESSRPLTVILKWSIGAQQELFI